MSYTLNEGQQAAADAVFDFLHSSDLEFNVMGPGGYGKTYLMSHIINHVVPEYLKSCSLMNIPNEIENVSITATTNKAAEVLTNYCNRPVSTVHSFFNLVVRDDHKTGQTYIKPGANWTVHPKTLLLVDEGSLIDKKLRGYIQAGLDQGSKIIYFGDPCQLPPVMEKEAAIYGGPIPFAELTQPVRNASQPALIALCEQIRETVKTGVFKDIKIVPRVIDHLSDSEFEQEIDTHFKDMDHTFKILAYTNKRVSAYNDHIRELRGYTSRLQVGENLICNQAITFKNQIVIPTESEVHVVRVDNTNQNLSLFTDDSHNIVLDTYNVDLVLNNGKLVSIFVPVDPTFYNNLLKYLYKEKMWSQYFLLKNTIPDLRPRDASTVHKAQGSTYDTVYVDLNDFNTCRDAHILARLLYVAVTRPRNRIVFYGNLSSKYGNLVQ